MMLKREQHAAQLENDKVFQVERNRPAQAQIERSLGREIPNAERDDVCQGSRRTFDTLSTGIRHVSPQLEFYAVALRAFG